MRGGAGCSVLIAAALIVFGALFFWAGRSLAPGDDADSRQFLADPSCGASAAAAGTRGACTWAPVTILSAEMRVSGFGRTRAHEPYVAVRRADGTIVEAQLDGSAGRVFVESARSGAGARAEFYRGALVRVVVGSDSAETNDAPDVNASSDVEMRWVGGVMIGVGALVVVVVFARRRRARAR